MNEEAPMNESSELPELSQQSIDRIERGVFATIAADRAPGISTPVAAGRKTRRRWLTGIGIAAAFVAGVLITPPLMNIGTGPTSESAGDWATDASDSVAMDEMAIPGDGLVTADGLTLDPASGAAFDASGDIGREIIASAQATVRVDDIAAASDSIADLAKQHGGYVESTDISSVAHPMDASMPVEQGEYGWISIRVPSADLTDVIAALGDTGTVVSSSTSQQDVTSTAIDLRARVDATQASVERLTELMAQSGSVSELIDAEGALTDRQAQLESYTQQLAALEDQVAMSSLNVQLTKQTTVTPPEPDGFTDGLLAGWNGLIASLNALVITVGFLLPWLVIAGAVVLVIWLIRRRRRRRAADSSETA